MLSELDIKLRDLILKSEGLTWVEAMDGERTKFALARVLLGLGKRYQSISAHIYEDGIMFLAYKKVVSLRTGYEKTDGWELSFDLTKDLYGQSTETKTALIKLLNN